MDRKKSDVWNHYSVINSEKAKCSYCSSSVSYRGGSTSNLSKHLKRKHIIQYDSRKHPRINEMNEQNVDEPSKQNTSVTNNDQNQPSTSINAINLINKYRPIQKSVDSYIINNKPLSVSKQNTIDEQLGVMISKEFQPFSLVENVEFKKFIYLLNPGYQLPSRKTVSKSILPQLYEKAREKVRNNLLNAKYISFTTDGWTSLNNDSFIAVTVHFIDPEECVLKTFLLGCFNVVESHTAVNLSLFLNNSFKEWNITEKVKVAVSDNAANITSAIGMNQNWRHIPCLAHTLNLIAQSGLGEIKNVHKKVKTVVEYFKRSTKANLKLKNAQKQMGYPELKLIQDVCTRWNSTYDMFQRCMDIKEPLMSTIAIIGNMDNLVYEDFEIIKHYCAIFKPFKEVTIELSNEKGISISKVIILIKALHSHIKNKENEPNLPNAIHLMLSKMLTKANTKFENIENQPILTEATILDPRFKKKAFNNLYTYQKTYEKIKQKVAGIIRLNQSPVENEENEKTISTDRENATSEIWQQFDSQVHKLYYN